MNSSFTAVMLASFLACAVTSVGIFTISRYEQWAKKHAIYFKSFAAGMLITITFLHIIPHAYQIQNTAFTFLLAGFLSTYLSNRLITGYIFQEQDGVRSMNLVSALGIGFHSFMDGVIYAVAFNVSLLTGILATIGMILHEFPEGIVTFVLLKSMRFTRRKAAIYAFLLTALSTPVGALTAYPFIHKISQSELGIALALSAGVLTYVGATHLLAEVEKQGDKYTILTLITGVLIAVLIIQLRK